FPATPTSDPIIIGAPMWYQQIPLYCMLILSPIIFIDYILLSRELIKIKPKIPQIAVSFSLCGFYFIILIFIMIFTNIWGYVDPVSGYFRNLFWLPYVILGLGILIPLLLVKKKSYVLKIKLTEIKKKIMVSGVIGILFFGIFIGGLIINASPSIPTQGVTEITLMTYNIQQGVNETGSKNYDQQLEVILAANPDIIAFQESDCARVGLGNSDMIRYFADKLDYYSYWGPKTIAGTFGAAILSRYPIISSQSIYSYSDKDEIGTSYVQIQVGDRVFNVFNNHPAGSDEAKLAHIEAVMDIIDNENLDNVVSMGDFNSRENSTYYNASVAVLKDTWLSLYPSGIDDNGLNMTRRIDHVFVSQDFSVESAIYIPDPESQTDHPVYWVTISW
ncbi:MAG: endonuclease/exonuclease/phosphatase family protein, partial [Promethearchaeota archaeon]